MPRLLLGRNIKRGTERQPRITPDTDAALCIALSLLSSMIIGEQYYRLPREYGVRKSLGHPFVRVTAAGTLWQVSQADNSPFESV